jgi:hypothetical protein
MSGKRAFVPLVVTAVLGIPSAAWSSSERERQAPHVAVTSCSLDGINPVWHPDVFRNPAVARAYGFIQSKDGSWHVGPNCARRY